MNSWNTFDGKVVFAWKSPDGTDYRSIWDSQTDTVELISSKSDCQTIAVVDDVWDLVQAKRVSMAWRSLINHLTAEGTASH